MICLRVESYAQWREKARALLLARAAPENVVWSDEDLLFEEALPPPGDGPPPRVPPAFLESAERAACYRGGEKWATLYRLLWRIVHENHELLDIASDEDVRQLRHMEAEVRRDGHKMKAFVRFRKVGDDYVAWHQPTHLTVERTAPFFARRFSSMRWAILTPDRCAYWDGSDLRFGPGLPRSAAPTDDAMEELWKTYYRNIFNPARVKVDAMLSEMPAKFWHTMPETALISSMLAEASHRVEQMVERAAPVDLVRRPDLWTARLLESGADLERLKEAAADCRGCDLCERATQMVWGEGSARPRLMLVGEQPGDQEDRRGQPFVGPAGKLLRATLKRVGADPAQVYLTNAVKHFRWESRPGAPEPKMRLHKTASPEQIAACKPWVEAEIRLARPSALVCLGATAAQSLLRRGFSVTRERGRPVASPLAPLVLATYHPSHLLRVPDEEHQRQFEDDLRLAWECQGTRDL